MREVVLDTETTGLEVAQGHRVIEIGCVEIVNRRITDRNFHTYLQPDREVDEGAVAIHGITGEFLADKPRFAEVANSFLEFVDGARLVIHNAAFDLGFLNHELKAVQGPDVEVLEDRCGVLDTLIMARRRHPGQRATLDALCKRYGVSNSHRQLHGALLDAELLAGVYLAMTSGQVALSLEGSEPGLGLPATHDMQASRQVSTAASRSPLPVIRASAGELAQHQAYLAVLDKAAGKPCLWRRLSPAEVAPEQAGEE